MNSKNILKSLNLTDGEVLTLEKLNDRMEFQALSPVAGMEKGGEVDQCVFYIHIDCFDCLNCPSLCSSVLNPCDCDGPVGYINCHPYKG
ncbi:MAG TPA: hypothetical protein DDW67_10230 [Elusimicrobia bacterium]|jgi:hypothetical protein|nr:hypothetical protein [Elusimicrobiota bacterium]